MNIGSFVTINLGTVIPPSSRQVFTPVVFHPPDLTGASVLSPDGALIFRDGDIVEMTAPIKFEGKDFLKWQVKTNGVLSLESIDNPFTITIKGQTEVMAIYESISVVAWATILMGLQSLPANLPVNSFVELTSV